LDNLELRNNELQTRLLPLKAQRDFHRQIQQFYEQISTKIKRVAQHEQMIKLLSMLPKEESDNRVLRRKYKDIQEQLQVMLRNFSLLPHNRLYIFSARGRLILRSDQPDQSPIDSLWQNNPLLRDALAGMTHTGIWNIDNQKVVAVSTPVYDVNKQVLGAIIETTVIGADFLLEVGIHPTDAKFPIIILFTSKSPLLYRIPHGQTAMYDAATKRLVHSGSSQALSSEQISITELSRWFAEHYTSFLQKFEHGDLHSTQPLYVQSRPHTYSIGIMPAASRDSWIGYVLLSPIDSPVVSTKWTIHHQPSLILIGCSALAFGLGLWFSLAWMRRKKRLKQILADFADDPNSLKSTRQLPSGYAFIFQYLQAIALNPPTQQAPNNTTSAQATHPTLQGKPLNKMATPAMLSVAQHPPTAQSTSMPTKATPAMPSVIHHANNGKTPILPSPPPPLVSSSPLLSSTIVMPKITHHLPSDAETEMPLEHSDMESIPYQAEDSIEGALAAVTSKPVSGTYIHTKLPSAKDDLSQFPHQGSISANSAENGTMQVHQRPISALLLSPNAQSGPDKQNLLSQTIKDTSPELMMMLMAQAPDYLLNQKQIGEDSDEDLEWPKKIEYIEPEEVVASPPPKAKTPVSILDELMAPQNANSLSNELDDVFSLLQDKNIDLIDYTKLEVQAAENGETEDFVSDSKQMNEENTPPDNTALKDSKQANEEVTPPAEAVEYKSAKASDLQLDAPSPNETSRAALSEYDTHLYNIYELYIEMRLSSGESVHSLSWENFRELLYKQREAIIKQYQCKYVRFQVYQKNGRAAIKASPLNTPPI
jgi:hypothetical protein